MIHEHCPYSRAGVETKLVAPPISAVDLDGQVSCCRNVGGYALQITVQRWKHLFFKNRQ